MQPAAPAAPLQEPASNRELLFRRLISALTAGREHPRLTTLLALLSVASIAGSAALIGVVRTFYYGHDVFGLFGAAWRFVNGQRPHVDFTTAFGPLTGIVYGTGMMLAGNSAVGIGYGIALISFTLGMLTWLLCRRRLLPIPALLAAVAVSLLTAAPFPIGFRFNTLSHAMTYNRWGYALLAMIILEAFSTPVDGRDATWGGIIAGAACVTALFDKASFFLVAVTFVAVSIPVSPSRRRLLGLLLGAAVAALAFLAYLHFDLPDMVRDLSIAAKARRSGMSAWGIKWAFFEELPYFLPLFVAAAAMFFDPWRDGRQDARTRYAPFVACALVLGGGALLLSSNAQNTGFPLITISFVLMMSEALRRGAAHLAAAPYCCVIAEFAFVCFLPGVSADACGLGYGLLQHFTPVPANLARFDQPNLRPLLLMDVPEPRDWEFRSNGREYVTYINDGAGLIQRVSPPSETVMAIDGYDPFSYALLRKPPRGGFTALGFNNTFNDESKPAPERLFGDVDIVMAPKFPSDPDSTFIALRRNYDPYLLSHFSLCAQSERWWLYKKKSNLTGCAAP